MTVFDVPALRIGRFLFAVLCDLLPRDDVSFLSSFRHQKEGCVSIPLLGHPVLLGWKGGELVGCVAIGILLCCYWNPVSLLKVCLFGQFLPAVASSLVPILLAGLIFRAFGPEVFG
ncbi:hypothetical protein SLE2022_347940 [Rubroshorea leprosula]